jgi:hypothetical protein
VLTVQVPGGSDLVWRILSLPGEIIQCQSYPDNYACSCGRVVMSDDDGTNSSTRVSVARRVWMHMVMSHLVQH